ncbi:MAG TPA: hypothetical protein VF828_03275 [Patescibacteria group bacterium]
MLKLNLAGFLAALIASLAVFSGGFVFAQTNTPVPTDTMTPTPTSTNQSPTSAPKTGLGGMAFYIK